MVNVVRQLGAILDGQCVEREVIGRQVDRAIERRLPALHRLLRQAVDEVEVDALEPGLAGPAAALCRLVRCVDAVERRQFVVVEGLYAEADAVDAGGQKPAQVRQIDRAGVGFERDLGALTPRPLSRSRERGEIEGVSQGRHSPLDLSEWKQ